MKELRFTYIIRMSPAKSLAMLMTFVIGKLEKTKPKFQFYLTRSSVLMLSSSSKDTRLQPGEQEMLVLTEIISRI